MGVRVFLFEFRFLKRHEFIMDIRKTIHVFEPLSEKDGAQVTISTDSGRKTFQLARPSTEQEQPPLAIESFAINKSESESSLPLTTPRFLQSRRSLRRSVRFL